MFRKIAQQFKKPSGFWGKIISNLMVKGNKRAYDRLIDYMLVQDGDKLFEIGYGPGTGLNDLIKKYNSCEIWGVDFSELMFQKASKINKEYIQNNKVNLFFGDFIVEQIDVAGFDKVFCINVVYFWEDLIKPFSKIRFLLKDEGVFYIFMVKREELVKLKFTTTDIFNKYTIEQILEALNLAGFRQVEYFYDQGYYIKAAK